MLHLLFFPLFLFLSLMFLLLLLLLLLLSLPFFSWPLAKGSKPNLAWLAIAFYATCRISCAFQNWNKLIKLNLTAPDFSWPCGVNVLRNTNELLNNWNGITSCQWVFLIGLWGCALGNYGKATVQIVYESNMYHKKAKMNVIHLIFQSVWLKVYTRVK